MRSQRMRDPAGRASAEATALDGDESTHGSTPTERARSSSENATSGPEATSSQGDLLSNAVSFDSLPLGARFKYLDQPGAVFAKLENGGTGLVAEWEHPALNWPGQGIYSFANSEAERARGMVEWVDSAASSGMSPGHRHASHSETTSAPPAAVQHVPEPSNEGPGSAAVGADLTLLDEVLGYLDRAAFALATAGNEELARCYHDHVVRLRAPRQPSADAEDAAMWRALVGCGRIRIVGSAGLHSENPNKYAFLTLELWTTYPGATTSPVAIETLEKFVSIAREAAESSRLSSLQHPTDANGAPVDG